MRELRGKRAFVTGAGSGIGKAIALALAREHVRLFLLDNNQELLDQAVADARLLGTEASPCCCDVGDAAQIASAVDQLLALWDGVDVLVNNAGIVYYGPTHEMTLAQWERLNSINLLGPIRLIHTLLPTLRKQPEAHILNVASITGLVPKRRIAAYQTSKFALVGLSQALRIEYSPYGIGVTVLCPGFVRTNLLDNAKRNGMTKQEPKLQSWWVMCPDRLAKQAVRSIKRNRSIVVTPLLARVFWWMHRLAPWLLDWHGHVMHRRAQRRRARKGRKLSTNPPTVAPLP